MAEIGAGCAQRLGRPESIRTLAQALRDSGIGVDQLLAELRKQVTDLVPRDWEGTAATSFEQHMQQEMSSVARASEKAQRLAQAALTLAGRLDGACRLFAEAQALAQRYQLTIEPRGNECWVYAHGPDTPETRAAHELAWEKVKAAQQEADVARQAFRWAIANDWRERLDILTPLALSAMIGMLSARRAGRQRINSSGPPPRFEFGEIKPLGAIRQGMTQLVDRGLRPGSNYALATYDNAGNVYLQVFTVRGNGTLSLTWSRQIGTVSPVPTMGNTVAGNQMEPYVRDMVSRAAGVRFRPHLPNAGGPDLIPE